QFQEEQDLTVFCLIDASASMFFPESDRKFQAAAEIGLGLLYVALSQHERVYLSILGAREVGPGSGAGFIHRLAEACEGKPQVSAEADRAGFQRFLHAVRHPGICIYLSDFLKPLQSIEGDLE